MKRRSFLRTGATAGELALLAQMGLLIPRAVLAKDWPVDAFHETDFQRALIALVGGQPEEGSGHVELKAKPIAEDGASVPVTVTTDLPGTVNITLFSVSNPTPALGRLELSPELGGYLSTRIKMAKTGDVVAVVSAGGKHYSDRKRIQVTAGGCG